MPYLLYSIFSRTLTLQTPNPTTPSRTCGLLQLILRSEAAQVVHEVGLEANVLRLWRLELDPQPIIGIRVQAPHWYARMPLACKIMPSGAPFSRFAMILCTVRVRVYLSVRGAVMVLGTPGIRVKELRGIRVQGFQVQKLGVLASWA